MAGRYFMPHQNHLVFYFWCLLALGCESSFLIDFSANTHAELISTPGVVASYSFNLAEPLDACRAIAKLLVQEQQCWHCKLIKSRCLDHCIYSVGNIFFAWLATWSNSKQGKVDKLKHLPTRPWIDWRSLSLAPVGDIIAGGNCVNDSDSVRVAIFLGTGKGGNLVLQQMQMILYFCLFLNFTDSPFFTLAFLLKITASLFFALVLLLKTKILLMKMVLLNY